jgi:hypothetical protein
VLHVSSDDQEHEQGGGDDYPIVELHQFWHVGSICHYIESSSEPACGPAVVDPHVATDGPAQLLQLL